MPYTTDQLQALQNALASGELRVRFTDREVEYRSVEELKAAIREVQIALGIDPNTPRVRQVRVYTDKGLN
jgi:hypothetical protein